MFTSLFELLIQTARPPVAGPVRLQVHGIEDSPDGTGTDGRHDAVVYGLASQILAGPVGDVQAFGDWLQAGPFDDLGTLEGGNLLRATQARLVQEPFLPAALLVAAAGPPDGGPVTLQAIGNGLNGFSSGDGQHDTGMLHLVKAEVAAACHSSQDVSIGLGDGQGTRFSARHDFLLLDPSKGLSSS
jgi:hypothetical protein